ncbi:Zygote defective protein 12, partial [Bienertia sinuspersici]
MPVMSPPAGIKPPFEKRVANTPMGATKPIVISRTPPTLTETTTLNKIPNENIVTNEPIQPLHHQFMHMNEDTQHMEQSPSSIHALSESRLQRDLEDSSSENEDFNQGGGRDVCATKVISSRPRRRTVIPDWPEHVKFDEKEEAIAFDVDGKRHLVNGPVQPRDVWNDRGLRYFVQFNEFNQPLRKGGCILVSFLGDVAKRETFCPVGVSSWHNLKKKMKANIVILVREDANNKVKECLASSSSKSRVDIENEVFDDLMYNGEVPKCPLNYGFGVKQSDIFGVQGLLRKKGSSYVNHNSIEMENLKAEFSAVKKQNEDLRQKNQALESKFDDTAQSFKAITSHLAQVLKEVRNGNASAHLLDGADSAIKLIDTQ